MALKSTLAIDVDDEAFNAFKQKFDKYKEQLGKMKGAWASAGKEAKAEEMTIADMTAALMAHAELIRKVNDSKKKNATEDTRAEKAWKNISNYTRSSLNNITSMTSSLLRWTSLTSVISGLLGLGGLFGIDRLAHDVSATRRSAMGLGLTYGEQKAFETNFSRVVDPNSFLSGVNESLHDLTKRYSLYGAGLTERDISGRDTGQIAAELIPQLKRIADQTPNSQLGQVITARGLDQFVTVQDMERLKAMSSQEIAALEASYKRDKVSFNLASDTQRRWQDFSTQMQRAGEKIENVFVKGLTPLTPALASLSDSIAKSIDTLMKSGKLNVWIKELGQGLQKTADYISSDHFQKDIKTFMEDITALAHWAASTLKFLGIIPDHDAQPPAKKGFWGSVGILANPFNLSPSENGAAAKVVGDTLSKGLKWAWNGGSGHEQNLRDASKRLNSLENARGIPNGVLLNMFGAETDYGRDVRTSGAGAQGLFQFMPATAKRYGVDDVMDFGKSSTGAANYIRDLLKEFHGDIAKAVAAYNWGEGHLERDIARWGSAWRDHLPKETSDYLNKVLNGAHLSHGVKVVIENNTGGNTIASASQIAQ